jgi:hypothetical protein
MNYILAPNLVLPPELTDEIKSLNWSKLPLAFRADQQAFLKQFIQTKKYHNWTSIRGFQRWYGFFAQKIGTLDSYHLPDTLLSKVQNHYNQFFNQLNEPPIIRLQIIYGGTLIPLHIDLTRSTSLIIPIEHEIQANTNFYTSAINPTLRGMINPNDCVLNNSIIINRIPGLLDVDQIHSVTYNKLTRESPRISLNLKWPTTKFNTVAKCLKGK